MVQGKLSFRHVAWFCKWDGMPSTILPSCLTSVPWGAWTPSLNSSLSFGLSRVVSKPQQSFPALCQTFPVAPYHEFWTETVWCSTICNSQAKITLGFLQILSTGIPFEGEKKWYLWSQRINLTVYSSAVAEEISVAIFGYPPCRLPGKSQCGRTVFCQKTGRTPFVLNCSAYLLLKPTGIAYRFSNVFAITLVSYFTVGQSVPCSHNDLTSNCHDFLEKDEL